MTIQVTSFQGMLASVAVMRYNNISTLGWHYSGVNWPFDPKIRRSIAAYIASRRDLTRYWHCHKFPYFIPTKLACRQERNLNLEYRTRSISSMCCSKIFRPIYIKIIKHQHKYVIHADVKYNRNRANLIYLLLCLRKTAITFGRECI